MAELGLMPLFSRVAIHSMRFPLLVVPQRGESCPALSDHPCDISRQFLCHPHPSVGALCVQGGPGREEFPKEMGKSMAILAALSCSWPDGIEP